MDDWGDIGYEDDDSRMGRRYAARRRDDGMRREQRFAITLAVAAAVMLVLGLGVGFALGRATAPKPEPATVVAEVTATVEPTVTPVVETTPSAEPTVTEEATTPPEPEKPTTPPDTPRTLDPDDGDTIKDDRVTLRWSKVTAEDDTPVKYAFEIQTRVNGKWTNSQVIDDLEDPSYKARVLVNRRRWRVWAYDEAGNKSDKSGWSYYQHTPEPERSSDTSGSGN